MTNNFSLAELTKTNTGLKNQTTDSKILTNLERLAKTFLQPLRDALNVPVIVNSGYRSPEVNKAVGGATNSSHLRGLAADIVVRSLTPTELSHYIARSNLPWDSIICEPSWVHVQIAEESSTPRKRLMTAKVIDGKMKYFQGLPA